MSASSRVVLGGSSAQQQQQQQQTTSSSSPLVNGSSKQKVSAMMDQQQQQQNHHRSRYADQPTTNSDPVYGNDGVLVRGSSSRNSSHNHHHHHHNHQKLHSTSSSASSSPSLSLARGEGQGSKGSAGGGTGGGNLVKQLVDNLYINSGNSSAKSSPVPSHLLFGGSSAAASTRASFRSGGGVQSSSSNNNSQRSFNSSQLLKTSSSNHEPNYDNVLQSPNGKSRGGVFSVDQQQQQLPSPSLDRKSATRASLPMGGSAAQHPYYYQQHRSGSGLSNASSVSSTAASGGGGSGQMYGQINSNGGGVSGGNSTRGGGAPKYLLDGDPLPVAEAAVSQQQTSPGRGVSKATNSSSPSSSSSSATWVEILQPKSRHKMFANLSTGECRWEEPKGVAILRANNPNITQWWELYDQSTGRFYYYSSRDFKTIWQKPTSPDAVVVPLAKLQILKQNTAAGANNSSSSNSHLNDSFDSGNGGNGGGGSSSGQVTPSSPSNLGGGGGGGGAGSPSHLFAARIKAWGGGGGGNGSPFGPIASPPVVVVCADATTQTIASAFDTAGMVMKPIMVTRATQTTGQQQQLTPTHPSSARIPNHHFHHQGHHPQQHQQQNPMRRIHQGPPGPHLVNGQQQQQNPPRIPGPKLQGQYQPSLHHYLLSEKRFAKGRYSVGPGQQQQQLQQQESIYDPVYGSQQPGNDFYDIVAADPVAPNQLALAGGGNNSRKSGGDYYEDVYEGGNYAHYYDYEGEDYYLDDEEDYYDDEDSDEEEEDSECDADDEFGGGESLESEEEEEEEEEEEDEDEDVSEDEDFEELDSLDGHSRHSYRQQDIADSGQQRHLLLLQQQQQQQQQQRHPGVPLNHQNFHHHHHHLHHLPQQEFDRSSDGGVNGSGGQFVRGHRQPLQVAQQQQQQPAQIRSSIKVSATSSKIPSQNDQKLAGQQTNQQQQQQQQQEGLRMSASFSAVDFKRNALGRSSYTAASLHQQQQQKPNPVPNQAQSYANPFNSGSLRSSTGRIGITAAAAAAQPSQQQNQQQQQQRSNIAERIQLFNQKSTTSSGGSLQQQQQHQHQSSPSPVIIHRTPSSPPGQQQQQQLTSTPNLISGPSARHSSGSSAAAAAAADHSSANLQRYFGGDRSPSSQTSAAAAAIMSTPPSSTQQQPSKSHSLSQIAPPQLPQNFSKQAKDLNNTSSVSSASDNYYALPPSSSSEALSSGTPQIGRRAFLGSFAPAAADGGSSEARGSGGGGGTSTRPNLANTFGHSLSVDVHHQHHHRMGSGGGGGGPISISPSSISPSGPISISSSTSAINHRNSGGGGQTPSGNSSFLGGFNDSHLVMLNKSQSVAVVQQQQPQPPGHGKGANKKQQKEQKEQKESKKESSKKSSSSSKTKKSKENKTPSTATTTGGAASPTKKKKAGKNSSAASTGGFSQQTPNNANTSIESFAKECVARHRKGGIFSAKKTLKSMLTHTRKPLKRPMISTISDSTLVKESVACFKLIQIYMGDRPASPPPPSSSHEKSSEVSSESHHHHQDHQDHSSSSISSITTDEHLLVRLINVCVALVPLRDEVLVQVARQVTQNPSAASEARGLELMAVLFWYFTASPKLAAHLQAFLAGHRNAPLTAVVRRKFEQQLYRARHTPHSVLFFRKPSSPEEVGRVLRCVRSKHGGLFGETLAEAIVGTPEGGNGGGGSDLKKQTLPWPMVLLTEALLEARHEDREGVFRCVGDMDDVHRLKMKIDTILPTDPHFAELIGRGRGGGGGNRSSNQSIYSIGKLTDAHDLHVIASTLKLYFRELREAVIPAELYLEALEAAHSPARATGLLERLPPVNRATLSYLIRFLQVFSAPEHVRDTKMDDANLSMVWAPNILRSLTPSAGLPGGPGGQAPPPPGSTAAATTSANIYEQTRAEMSLVRTLIQHLDTSSSSISSTTTNNL